MSRRSPGHVRRVAVFVGVVLISSPVKAGAQDLASAVGVSEVAPVAALALAESQLPSILTSESPVAPALSVSAEKRGALLPLYVSFAVLQALDVQSTRTALGGGGREANPVMTDVVSSPAAFLALKAAAGTAVIFASEKMRTRNRVAALITMAALNGLYATIVSHNYAVAGR